MIFINDYSFIPFEFSQIEYKDGDGNDITSYKISGLVADEKGYFLCTIFDNKDNFALSADDFNKIIHDRNVLTVTGVKSLNRKSFIYQLNFNKISISKQTFSLDLH